LLEPLKLLKLELEAPNPPVELATKAADAGRTDAARTKRSSVTIAALHNPFIRISSCTDKKSENINVAGALVDNPPFIGI
jgi:hypothetical protein